MATFTGTKGGDNFTGTAAADQFSTGGGGTDRFTDTEGGNDSYLIYRAADALFFSGEVVITDSVGSGDKVDITDFVSQARSGGLAFAAVGDGLADLQITSGGNRLILAKQLLPTEDGIETVVYEGKTVLVGSFTEVNDFRNAIIDLVSSTDRLPKSIDTVTPSINEDSGSRSYDLTRFVADQDGTALSYSIKTLPNNGEASINGNVLTFTPRKDADTDSSILVQYPVGNSLKTFSIPIDLNPVNDAPTQIDATLQLKPGQQLTFDMLKNVVDVDSNNINLVNVSPSSPTALGSYDIKSSKDLIFTAGQNTGTTNLTIEFSDDLGLRGKSNLAIKVAADNLAPKLNGSEPSISIDENSGTQTLDLRNFVSDPNGDPLTFSALGGSALGGVALSSDGIFSFTPKADTAGEGAVRFRVSDGELSFDSQVSLQVAEVNTGPTANDDEATLGLGKTFVNISVLANDSDPDGDKLTVTEVSADNVSILANGTLRYDRVEGGPNSFTYKVADPSGATSQATVSVSIPVEPSKPRDTPITIDDLFTASSESKLLKGLKIDPLKNDTSPLGKKGLDKLSLKIVDDVDHGQLLLAKGKLVYKADDSFDGSDSFTYTVASKLGNVSDIGTVVISGPDLT